MELTQSQHNHSGAIVILLLVFCGFTVMDIVDAVVSTDAILPSKL